MKVLNFDYDLENGFVWILVDGQEEGQENIVQCCLVGPDFDPIAEEQPLYLQEINAGNCGHNEGGCADANEAAFKYWGENRCMQALFAEAKAQGFTVNY